MPQVAEGELQLSLEDENLVKNRTFLCTFASPYYEFCETGTSIPKWCANNPTAIFCPDDVGYEYDPVTGGGGESGGGGAGRDFTGICFDANYNIIPCPANQVREVQDMYNTNNDYPGGYMRLGFKDPSWYPANNVTTCYDLNGVVINCNLGDVNTALRIYTDATNYVFTNMVYNGQCIVSYYDKPPLIGNCVIPIKASTLENTNTYIDKDMRILTPNTYVPLENDNFIGGVPIPIEPPPPPPPDPYDIEVPVGNEECGAICTWLSYIYNIMRVVNQSVLKVDASIQEMVSKMTGEEVPINSVLLEKLNEILVAIDKVSFELVKEAETNFWDVLGTGLGDIFDFVEFLIDKVIYLVVPEDSTQIMNNFDRLSKDIKDKVKPLHDIQVNITEAVTIEDKQFTNIEIDLPTYGVVPFYKVDYLLEAMPYIRMLLGGMMIMTTSIWAYRKVSSELIK